MHFTLTPKQVGIGLLWIVFFLTVANIGQVYYSHFVSRHDPYFIGSLFDFNKEYNIPTLYSSVTLLLCALLLFVIALSKRKSREPDFLYWLVLAAVFVFLSVDESALIHERLIRPMRSFLKLSGLFYYSWVIPYSVGLSVFLLMYARFIVNLPKRIRLLFVISGIIYVCGAVGFEMLGGLQAEKYGERNIVYSLIYTCEELFEMLGIVLFLYALVSYVGLYVGNISISISIK